MIIKTEKEKTVMNCEDEVWGYINPKGDLIFWSLQPTEVEAVLCFEEKKKKMLAIEFDDENYNAIVKKEFKLCQLVKIKLSYAITCSRENTSDITPGLYGLNNSDVYIENE